MMVVVAVSVWAVVATCGFVSVVLPATTRAEEDARDHQDNDHRHDNKERTHADSPFSDFPRFMPDFTCGLSVLTNCGTFFGRFANRPYRVVRVRDRAGS